MRGSQDNGREVISHKHPGGWQDVHLESLGSFIKV